MRDFTALLDLTDGEFAMHYGSRDRIDHDVVAVVNDSVMLGWDFRGLDLLVMGKDVAESLLADLDPRIVEPALTAHHVEGDTAAFASLHERVLQARSSADTPVRLLKRGRQLLHSVESQLASVALSSSDTGAVRLLTDLGYALSLVVLGGHYRHPGTGPALLRDVVTDEPLLREVRSLLAAVKRGYAASPGSLKQLVAASERRIHL